VADTQAHDHHKETEHHEHAHETDHHKHDHHEHDHSHEHTHEHTHEEGHKCEHGHDHSHEHDHENDLCCFHKVIIRWLIKVTHADEAFDMVDAFMRPLPFLAQSLISTTFISVVPIFIIYFMNVFFMGDEKTRESFTYVLLSFALGGLLGDVFFHTIPHLSSGGHSHDHTQTSEPGHDHSHDHSHGHGGHSHSEEDMQTNLIIVVGIWFFFLIDKLTH